MWSFLGTLLVQETGKKKKGQKNIIQFRLLYIELVQNSAKSKKKLKYKKNPQCKDRFVKIVIEM